MTRGTAEQTIKDNLGKIDDIWIRYFYSVVNMELREIRKGEKKRKTRKDKHIF